jgi:hypothetical protein
MKHVKLEAQAEIEILDGGLVSYRSLPIDRFMKVADFAQKLGFGFMDPGCGMALGGIVFTPGGNDTRLRDQITAAAREAAEGDAELEWALGCDIGVSSCAIMAALGKSERARAIARTRIKVTGPQPPHDKADLARCGRLIGRFPHMATDFEQRIGDVYPAWLPVLSRWGQNLAEALDAEGRR